MYRSINNAINFIELYEECFEKFDNINVGIRYSLEELRQQRLEFGRAVVNAISSED